MDTFNGSLQAELLLQISALSPTTFSLFIYREGISSRFKVFGVWSSQSSVRLQGLVAVKTLKSLGGFQTLPQCNASGAGPSLV